MDKRIPDLTQIQFSAITANDVLPIVNISTDETNKITIDQIKNYVNSGVTDTYITGGTYFTGGTIIFDYNTGSNFEVSGLTEDLNNEIAGLAETDEQTITLNLDTNKIELKEIVASATGGTRTFQGDFAISGGTLNLNTIGSGSPVINLGLDSSGEVVTGTTDGFTYQIGQYVEEEGGVIFHSYKDGTNENYLVVAIDDQSTGITWSNITNQLAGADSTWNGLENSLTITGQTGHTESAAQLCLEYVNGGCDTISVTYQLKPTCDTIFVTYKLFGEDAVTVEVESLGVDNGKNYYGLEIAEVGTFGISWGDPIAEGFIWYVSESPEFNVSQATLSEDTPCPFGEYTIEVGSPFESFIVSPVTTPEPVTVEVASSGIEEGKPYYFISNIDGPESCPLYSKEGSWFIDYNDNIETATLSADTPCPFGTYTIEEGSIFESFSVASVNPIDDWYLPAIDELSLLWQNRFNVNRTLSGNSSFGSIPGATQIGYDRYWSSTEYDDSNAWGFYFSLGNAYYNFGKSSTLYVRAVRKFSI